ncbi:MAG: hypothetical protein KGS72_27030 [Cyanobacteria bacterium REEB67]|nr:hypothetical protein [Cyanobacteria bacterium REEB67]
MPKNSAGKNEPIPVKWCWGTFCRQVLVDAATGQDPTLVGVCQGIDVNVETPVKLDFYEIGLVIWLHAVFRAVEIVDEDRKFNISVKLTLDNQPSVVQVLEVPNKAGKEWMEINMNLPMMQPEQRLKLPEGKSLLRMSFRYSTTQLGMVELPIRVMVKVSDKKDA